MVDFAGLIALAQRLISENGRSVTLIEFDTTPPDPSKPWKGPADPRANPASQLTLDATFVSPGSAAQLGLALETSDLIKLSEQILIMSPGANVDVTVFHEVIDDGETWKIETIEVLRPATDVLVVYMGVKS